MILFPTAKINLGLNIVEKRSDGYHNIETIFYPIPLCDALEIKNMDENFPSTTDCDLKITGNQLEGNEQDNLVVKAYQLLKRDFKLPRIHIHLYKQIPSQAGLGGGSSDAAFMIKLLDERFRLNLGYAEMERYAANLGADCAFFIRNEAAFAEAIGSNLSPMDELQTLLQSYYIGIVKPPVAVSTQEAYAHVVPQRPATCCKDIVKQPVETWKDELKNDFETSVFKNHPQLKEIKEELYRQGACYASMSGSGSSLYGLFKENPKDFSSSFPNCYTFAGEL